MIVAFSDAGATGQETKVPIAGELYPGLTFGADRVSTYYFGHTFRSVPKVRPDILKQMIDEFSSDMGVSGR